MTKVAVLDDWQGIAESSTDWSPLMAVADVVFFKQAFNDEEAAVRNLSEFECLLTMRERSPLPGSLINRLRKQAQAGTGTTSIVVRPIGQDPEELRALNQGLNIWDAYATIHLLMPDGSMKLGGEAVAEVLRHLPSTRWFTWTFAINIFGIRPFQAMLNLAYAILADVRPVFGCESCGTPSPWVRPIRWMVKWIASLFGKSHHPSPYFTSLPGKGRSPQAHHI